MPSRELSGQFLSELCQGLAIFFHAGEGNIEAGQELSKKANRIGI